MTDREKFFTFLFSDLRPEERINVRSLGPLDDDADENDPRPVDNRFADSVAKALRAVEAVEKLPRYDIYVAVAPRQGANGKKEAVLDVGMAWGDYDPDNAYGSLWKVLPPSMLVASGKGHHAYYKLDKRENGEKVEGLNKDMTVLGADVASTEYGKILRVPDTLNFKRNPEGDPVRLVSLNPERIYKASDIAAFLAISSKASIWKKLTNNLVKLNSDRGKKKANNDGKPVDKSDLGALWFIASTLQEAGCSADFLQIMYEAHDLGARGDKADKSWDHFKKFTLPGIERAVVTKQDSLSFKVHKDGLFYEGERVATFSFEPTAILKEEFGEDAFIGTVHNTIGDTPNVILPRSAFQGVRDLNDGQHLPRIGWMWLGAKEAVVREYLDHLTHKAIEQGIPTKNAYKASGRHGDYWTVPGTTFDASGVYATGNEPVLCTANAANHPRIRYTFEDATATIRNTWELLPKINEESVLWPTLGWFMATPFKAVLREQNLKFPILNIWGPPGSGKSTLSANIMARLMGYTNLEDVRSAPGQSKSGFSLMSQLGLTNGVPLIYDECTPSAMPHAYDTFISTVVQSYDSLRADRGKANQSVIDYPKLAPVCLVGEVMIHNANSSAIMERTVFVAPKKGHISEKLDGTSTNAARAYAILADMEIERIIGTYLKYTLTAPDLYDRARVMIREAFPDTMDNRVRHNITVVAMGLLHYEAFGRLYDAYCPEIGPLFLREAFGQMVKSILTPTGFTLNPVDEMIADICRSCAFNGPRPDFEYYFDTDRQCLVVYMGGAIGWWRLHQTRLGHTAPNEKSLRQQLTNAKIGEPWEPGQYILEARTVRFPSGTNAHGHFISIAHAIQTGLDIPENYPAAELIKSLIQAGEIFVKPVAKKEK